MTQTTSDGFSLLSPALRQEVESLAWEQATAIQALAIPRILQGESVLLIAPTGTGKTEAAVYPIFEQFLRIRQSHPQTGISILYITPLRALNRDIFRRLIETGRRLGIRVQVRHGDTTQYARRQQALRPPDMLITTPETLQAILPGTRMRRHLSAVRWVVVDEVHELATDKRGAQLTLGLERLRKLAGRDFQRLGLSATVGSPERIACFLFGQGTTYRVLKTVEAKDLAIRVESPTADERDGVLAKKVMLSPGSVTRIRRLFDVIDAHPASLIFTNTREHAEALASRMIALRPDVQIGVHHGSLSKTARVDAETGLKAGHLKAVICTSSLELGIDVGRIEFVVQYLSPKQVTKLVQRIGRSGHVVAGRSQGCVIAAWPDDILESAVIVKFALNGILESPTIHEKALDVLAHQVAGVALDWGWIRLEDLHALVTGAWPYRDLSVEELTAVIEMLADRRILWFDGDVVQKRYPRVFQYYYENLSMIPDVTHYSVVDFLRRKRIGRLDQEFIAKNGDVGQEFIMRGQTWRLISVSDDERLVQVEPVTQSFGAIPSWEGEVIPVPFPVAQEVGRMRGAIADALLHEGAAAGVFTGFPLDEDAGAKVIDVVAKQIQQKYPVPTDKRVLIEGFESYVIVHSCFGNLVNEALGKAVAALLSSRFGINVGTQVDAYHIAFISPTPLPPAAVRTELLSLTPDDLDHILSSVLGSTALFAWRLWNVAKRFGLVSRSAEYRSSRARMLASTLQHTPVYTEALREIHVDKMDLDNAAKVLKRMQDGLIEIDVASRRREYSPLALPILDRIAPHDILRPAAPTRALLDVVRERLGAAEVRLVCVFSGDYNGVRNLRSLPDPLRCPNCRSTLLAATHPKDHHLITVIKKRLSKRTLTTDEEQIWLTAWKSASLVQAYGKKALLALAARGVGPTTAVRILHKYHRTEDDFYTDIIRAERDYARTRMFWDN
jgi:ATP-dependent Lhr-like helicase